MHNNLHVIAGLGVTGLSCLHYLKSRGIPVAITDSRAQPPNLETLQKEHIDVKLSLGKLDEDLLAQAAVIVISPGLSLQEPAIAKQIAKGIPVIGDIELFAQAAKAPVIAITGTNAKSTVTTLVGMMGEAAGLNTKVGGNLGTPALDLLDDDAQLYVLEISSFQLETTYSLKPDVATILNVTPDHMDRYATVEDYRQAKVRVYHDCQVAVCNRDDPQTDCGDAFKRRKVFFTLAQPREGEFGLVRKEGQTYLAHGDKLLLTTKELPVKGRHYQANALAALALGDAAGLPMEAMLRVLREFKGLPHRCQFVRERKGVIWYNDSKGTNVGATIAAIEGIGSEIDGKLILIAGGLGKNADFSPLVPVMEKYVRAVILIGEAAPVLAEVIDNRLTVHYAQDMQEAVNKAAEAAEGHDCVLLSPACASWDMYKNYGQRGDIFMSIVQELT